MDDIITEMERVLVPPGSLPVVKLRIDNAGYYEYDKIKKCIEELQKLPMRQILGEPLNELEKLAITVLMDSAYINDYVKFKESK